MANRSDKNAVLPRRLKRMIALMGIHEGWTNEREGVVRRSFIEAHTHAKSVQRGALRLNVGPEDTATANVA